MECYKVVRRVENMKVFFYFDVFISLRGDYPNALLNFERGITNKDEVPLSVLSNLY